MKYMLIIMLAFSFSIADYLSKETLACPNVMLLKKAPLNQGEGGLDLTFYAISNGCMILSKKDKVEAIGYDPSNSKAIFQEIVHKATGNKLFIKRESLVVEQGGKNNIYRF